MWNLSSGKTAKGNEPKRETCIVFISGKGEVKVDGKSFGVIGDRMNVFDGKPWSVFVPMGAKWSVSATTDCVINICTAPAKKKAEAFVISPDELSIETRGAGSNTRYVCNILPEQDKRAESLLVVEVITPNGCTSSYPSSQARQEQPAT